MFPTFHALIDKVKEANEAVDSGGCFHVFVFLWLGIVLNRIKDVPKHGLYISS